MLQIIFGWLKINSRNCEEGSMKGQTFLKYLRHTVLILVAFSGLIVMAGSANAQSFSFSITSGRNYPRYNQGYYSPYARYYVPRDSYYYVQPYSTPYYNVRRYYVPDNRPYVVNRYWSYPSSRYYTVSPYVNRHRHHHDRDDDDWYFCKSEFKPQRAQRTEDFFVLFVSLWFKIAYLTGQCLTYSS